MNLCKRPRSTPGKRWDAMKLGEFYYGYVAYGNMTQHEIFMCCNINGEVIIGIYERGCYKFAHYAHMSYVSEKLNLGLGDAGNVADLINGALGIEPYEDQGFYYPDLLKKEEY